MDVDSLIKHWAEASWYNLGFPGATDIDYSPLGPTLGVLLNNVGDPGVRGVALNHTKDIELRVVRWLADLFRAPINDRWGYVTSCGTESNLYALHAARSQHPNTIVYHSSAAHPSIPKAVQLLGLDHIVIATGPEVRSGEMDYGDLDREIQRHRDRPATVVATAGTTMTEAFDDVREITRILDSLPVRRRYVHVDAALSGVPLGLEDPAARPGLDFEDGADSIAVSGHKIFGVPFPCGVVITRAHHRARVAQASYTGSPDTTIGGSRSGHAPLALWWAIEQLGAEGLRRRAQQSRALAAYMLGRLEAMGWDAYRQHPLGFTVVLATPPPAVTGRWVLADGGGGYSHVVCMPGVTRERIDGFLGDLAAAAAPHIPSPRGEPQPAPA